jgi:predicted dienelactone hydrolase
VLVAAAACHVECRNNEKTVDMRLSMRGIYPLLAMLSMVAGSAAAYDPLAVPDGQAREFRDLDVIDGERDRTVPIRLFLPRDGRATAPFPVVLFSHGLGGSRKGCGFLGEHWSQRGYAAVFVEHPGSNEAVWQAVPPAGRMAAMRDAASLENFRLRVGDIAAVLDQLGAWNSTHGHPLAGQLDLDRVGMSGHSFGGQTTQAVSGQSFPLVGRRFTDPRIKAAVIMSPGTQRGRLDAGGSFGEVVIPWLLLTGTKDKALIGGQSVESRLAVFPALPPGQSYELVLHDAEHSAFTDRSLPGDKEPRNPNHHRSILAITTAFWDGFLRKDAAARDWLDGSGPRGVLEAEDRWQRK